MASGFSIAFWARSAKYNGGNDNDFIIAGDINDDSEGLTFYSDKSDRSYM